MKCSYYKHLFGLKEKQNCASKRWCINPIRKSKKTKTIEYTYTMKGIQVGKTQVIYLFLFLRAKYDLHGT